MNTKPFLFLAVLSFLASPLLGQDCLECHKKQTPQSLREIQAVAAEMRAQR